jgi:hypothetical protein
MFDRVFSSQPNSVVRNTFGQCLEISSPFQNKAQRRTLLAIAPINKHIPIIVITFSFMYGANENTVA